MGRRINSERRYQMRIGYSRKHDKEMGVWHLLEWAWIYFWRLHWVKSASMVVAAYQLKNKNLHQWGARLGHSQVIWFVARDGADASNQFKKLYGYTPDYIWKEYE